MSKLWCVKGNINAGEMFVSADSVEISLRGELAFYRENGSRSLVLAVAPGAWMRALRLSLMAARRPSTVTPQPPLAARQGADLGLALINELLPRWSASR
jgi:hypothetical protein